MDDDNNGFSSTSSSIFTVRLIIDSIQYGFVWMMIMMESNKQQQRTIIGKQQREGSVEQQDKKCYHYRPTTTIGHNNKHGVRMTCSLLLRLLLLHPPHCRHINCNPLHLPI